MPNRAFYHPLPPPSKEGVKGKGILSGGASAPPEGSQETGFLYHHSLRSFRGARKRVSYTIKASAPSGEPGNGFLTSRKPGNVFLTPKPLLLSQGARKRISRPR